MSETAPTPLRQTRDGAMRTTRRLAGYLPNALRLAVFAFALLAALLALTARAVARELAASAMAFGRELLAFAERAELGPARELEVNGARLGVEAGVTGDGVPAVLDAFARRCETAARPGERPRTALGQRLGEQRGFVACLDLGGHTGGARMIAALTERARAFAASGDFATVGGLRYLYAERAASGRTRFVGVWSAGAVNLRRMFPRQGDAPGLDALALPPPMPGLRAVLSAREADRGARGVGLAVLTGRASVRAVAAHYRDAMRASGWSELPLGRASAGPDALSLAFQRAGATATLVLAPAATRAASAAGEDASAPREITLTEVLSP